jgi:DNA-binding response OmpR family regulator
VITIHRTKPLVNTGDKSVKLSKDEHLLITTLGMMDDKLIPIELLIEAMSENRVQIPADTDVLTGKISRLRKKIGREFVINKRGLGYQLTEAIQFTG